MLWVGGHTEVTSAVARIVVSGHAVGFLPGRPLSTSGARPGDLICLTKWVGLEGTTLIAREQRREAEGLLGKKRFREVLSWLETPGISIVGEGRALEGLPLTSGHDPTEGGVAMGIYEVCRRSGAGAQISFESLPIREETRLLCARFRIDPLGLLSSGVFLFTAPRPIAERSRRLLAARGIPCAIVGEMRPKREGILLERGGKKVRLRASAQDQIVALAKTGEVSPSAPSFSPRSSRL
jgi:hydrogenase maturation factor